MDQLTGSVFETFRDKMTAQGENLVRLHIGDTYLPVRYSLPIDPVVQERHGDYNRYCNTFGIAPLREVLADKLRTDNKLDVQSENILMTSGATNALSVSMMALVEPGDEVLILTPAWPFFFGMVQVAGGEPVEVPFYTRLFEQPHLDVAAFLEEHVSDRTVAIYLNTPNNPSGKVLDRNQLQSVADVAKRHDLWVISDEAYDGMTFDGREHLSIATLPGMFERTVSIFTFSKSFMFAGLRLGYAVAPTGVVKSLNKVMVHQIYGASTLAQQMMIEPVKTRHQWLEDVREHYRELRDLFVAELAIDFPTPEGTYFIFFCAEEYLKGRDYRQLIEACLDAGVSVAPGDSFGADFHHYIRLCFTGEPRDRLRRGIQRLNAIFC